MSLIFSNVPGPRIPYDFAGAKSEWCTYVGPTMNSLGVACYIISHMDTLKICIRADKTYMDHAEELLDLFETNFATILK